MEILSGRQGAAFELKKPSLARVDQPSVSTSNQSSGTVATSPAKLVAKQAELRNHLKITCHGLSASTIGGASY